MLYDQFCVQIQNIFGQKIVIPRNGNLNLAQNVVEQMTGDSNLIGVRSRATLNRPFTVVQEMQAQAEASYRNKIKEIEDSLRETQTKLNELQSKKEKGQQRFILSPEQQAELEKFRKKEAEAKRELKEVRKNLRKDIDALENTLKWANIAGMPLLVAAFGIVLAVVKNKRARAK
jgi:DNA repair exonuclease SbcCD ATPase subunit